VRKGGGGRTVGKVVGEMDMGDKSSIMQHLQVCATNKKISFPQNESNFHTHIYRAAN